MATRSAGCPDTVATLTWLNIHGTFPDIFARVPLVISARNTGPGRLPSSAENERRSSRDSLRTCLLRADTTLAVSLSFQNVTALPPTV